MNTIKELLENHREQPSDEVWKRLSARLDEEMPVVEKLANRGRSVTWKRVAAAIAVVVVCGGIAFLVTMINMLGHRPDPKTGNEDLQPVNVAEVVEKEEVDAIEMTESPLLADNNATAVPAAAPEKPAKENAPVAAPQEPAPAVPKVQHVRQEVLPANSTLARQLAADPVLKNLSDDSVDWSKPAHLSIPNLFTPNGDNVNDQFIIDGIEHYSSPKLVVRDKNNRIVYQSSNYQNSWGGENCPDGVYNYEFTFFYNGIENQAIGKVRIIRA